MSYGHVGHPSRQSQQALHFHADQWHGERVTELRICRRQLGFSQCELAAVLTVPPNSLRMWDSGLRPTPSAGINSQPDEVWMTQVARNLTAASDGFLRGMQYVIAIRCTRPPFGAS